MPCPARTCRRNLSMAYLIGADPARIRKAANLTNAELSQANLTNANFSGDIYFDIEFGGVTCRALT